MTKEHKIQEAYGDYWEKVKQYVEDTGLLIDPLTSENVALFIYENKDVLEYIDTDVYRLKSLSGIENNNGWTNVEDILPEEGIEVICFNEDWINEDFNPKGVRIGFLNGSEWTTAHYWNYQDTYMTISHTLCDDDDEFSNEIRENIDPTHYRLIADKPPIY